MSQDDPRTTIWLSTSFFKHKWFDTMAYDVLTSSKPGFFSTSFAPFFFNALPVVTFTNLKLHDGQRRRCEDGDSFISKLRPLHRSIFNMFKVHNVHIICRWQACHILQDIHGHGKPFHQRNMHLRELPGFRPLEFWFGSCHPILETSGSWWHPGWCRKHHLFRWIVHEVCIDSLDGKISLKKSNTQKLCKKSLSWCMDVHNRNSFGLFSMQCGSLTRNVFTFQFRSNLKGFRWSPNCLGNLFKIYVRRHGSNTIWNLIS